MFCDRNIPASGPKGGVLFIHIFYSNIVDTTGKTIAIIDPRADLRCAIIICKETPGNNEGSTDPKHRNASQEEKQPKGRDLDREPNEDEGQRLSEDNYSAVCCGWSTGSISTLRCQRKGTR